jgi:hypothetical protein
MYEKKKGKRLPEIREFFSSGTLCEVVYDLIGGIEIR